MALSPGPNVVFPLPPPSGNSVLLARPKTSLRRRSGGLEHRGEDEVREIRWVLTHLHLSIFTIRFFFCCYSKRLSED